MLLRSDNSTTHVICDSCTELAYAEIDDLYYHTDDLHQDTAGEYCLEPRENDGDEELEHHDCTFTRSPDTPDNQLHIGIEYECYPIGQTPLAFKRGVTDSFTSVSGDSSLNEGGAEVQTAPRLPEVVAQQLKELLDTQRLYVDGACGMHVNLSWSEPPVSEIVFKVGELASNFLLAHEEIDLKRWFGRSFNDYATECYEIDNKYCAVSPKDDRLEFRLPAPTTDKKRLALRIANACFLFNQCYQLVTGEMLGKESYPVQPPALTLLKQVDDYIAKTKEQLLLCA